MLTRAELLKKFEETKVRVEGLCAVPIVDGDRLILFTFSDKKRCGIYILRANGNRTQYRVGAGWGHSGILSAWGIEHYYGWDRYNRAFHWNRKSDEQVCRAFIAEHFGSDALEHLYKSEKWGAVVAAIVEIEERVNRENREAGARRHAQRVTDHVAKVPPLPDRFMKWVDDQIFPENYAFGKKDCDRFFCTACGKEHTSKVWKHGEKVTCRRTGKEVKVEKKKTRIDRTEGAFVFQNMPDGTESAGQWVNLHLTCCEGGRYVEAERRKVLFMPKDGKPAGKYSYLAQSYGWFSDSCNHGGGPEWDDKTIDCNLTYHLGRIWPEGVKEALAGTAYDHMGLEVAALRGTEHRWFGLMIAHRGSPAFEYLVKGGFDGLLSDMEGGNTLGMRLSERKPADVLRVSPQNVARIRDEKGGKALLYWLRHAEKHGYKLPKDAAEWLCKSAPEPDMFCFVDGLVSPEQIFGYMSRQAKKERRTVAFLAGIWRDVISMSYCLKLDMTKDMNVRPKELRRRHDELVEIINEKDEELRREELSEKYPEVESALRKISQLFSWKNDTYSVQVPAGVYDIMREGRLQHHCVGSSEIYFDRIAQRESYILFLRKTEAPETPWYTMEVEPSGRVRQLRTMGDSEGGDRDRAKEALKEWRTVIARRMGREDIRDAEVSCEKRLAEFEKLRAERNLIRNGKHAGELLVDVLEADYRELNEETA